MAFWRRSVTFLMLTLPTFTVMQQCSNLLTLQNIDLNIQASAKTNENAHSISTIDASSSDECFQACCENDACSIVVFQEDVHRCHLHACFPFKNCVTYAKSGWTLHFVGHVEAPETKTSTPGKLQTPTKIPTTNERASPTSISTNVNNVNDITLIQDAASDTSTTPAQPELLSSTITSQTTIHQDQSLTTASSFPSTQSAVPPVSEATHSSTHKTGLEQVTSTIYIENDLDQSSEGHSSSPLNDSDTSTENSADKDSKLSTTVEYSTESTTNNTTGIVLNTSTQSSTTNTGSGFHDLMDNRTEIEITTPSTTTDIEVEGTTVNENYESDNSKTIVTSNSSESETENHTDTTPSNDATSVVTVSMNDTQMSGKETDAEVVIETTTNNNTEPTKSPGNATTAFITETVKKTEQITSSTVVITTTETSNTESTKSPGNATTAFITETVNNTEPITRTSTVVITSTGTALKEGNTTSVLSSVSTVNTSVITSQLTTPTMNVSSSSTHTLPTSTSEIPTTTTGSSSTIIEETSTNHIVTANATLPVSRSEINNTDEDHGTSTKAPSYGFHFSHQDNSTMTGALIAALSFGIIFLCSVLVLLGKRFYDSWQRRHYNRLDYLINGMYN